MKVLKGVIFESQNHPSVILCIQPSKQNLYIFNSKSSHLLQSYIPFVLKIVFKCITANRTIYLTIYSDLFKKNQLNYSRDFRLKYPP